MEQPKEQVVRLSVRHLCLSHGQSNQPVVFTSPYQVLADVLLSDQGRIQAIGCQPGSKMLPSAYNNQRKQGLICGVAILRHCGSYVRQQLNMVGRTATQSGWKDNAPTLPLRCGICDRSNPRNPLEQHQKEK
eukprot:scaffold2047_cov129-Cylindrotheca_fusiformis.AAC.38